MLKFLLSLPIFLFLAKIPSSLTAPVATTTHYKLALQWPLSYCMTKSPNSQVIKYDSCNVIAPMFTIHGFWAQNAADYGVDHTICNKQRWDLAQVDKTTKTWMNNFWPNLDPDHTNDEFWENEWKKHGVCFNMPLADYFKKVVELMEELQEYLLWVYDHRAFYPTNTKPFLLTMASRYFSNALGTQVRLKCYQDKRKGNVLLEVHVCYDLQFKVRNCPKQYDGCVSSNQLWLPFY